MLGLFGLLNLGARSLEAQQAGVAVAGQNLANINNPAYARQRVTMQTSLTLDTGFGPQGTGVQVTGIAQIRDLLLDGQIRDELSVGGFWGAAQSGLESVQTGLAQFFDQSASGVNSSAGTENSTVPQGLAAQLSNLFNAFQSIAANPTSLAERQSLVNQAQVLASSFNQISTRLGTVNGDLNSGIANDVTSANQLLADIAGLNQDIANAEVPGRGTANDLRDLREQKLETLARLVNFQTSTAADGTLSLSIGGLTLVSGRQVLDSLQSYDGGGGQLLVRAASGAAVALTGGSIQGAIGTRDGALADLRNGLDTLASQLVNQVNAVYRTGYGLNGTTGADFFTGTSAATIGVNGALQTDPSLVQAAGVPGAAGDNTVALALAQMARQSIAGLNNQTFNAAFGSLVVSLGNSLADANNQVTNQDAVNSMLLQQRDSVSGVSMEEEMTNLTTFQKAYQASARIITTVDQMLDTVINMKSS